MLNKIRILIVNDNRDSIMAIRELLTPNSEFKIIGDAIDGREAIDLTNQYYPDIVLMDTHMPNINGYDACLKITQASPFIGVILVGYGESPDILRKSMRFGADDYLELPLSKAKLYNAIIALHKIKQKQKEKLLNNPLIIPNREPKVVTVFSTKGGVGKSVVSTNVAIALRKATKEDVLLMDLDLQFGDVAELLNINPKTSIIDLLADIDKIDVNEWSKYLSTHYSGISVLTSPFKPEQADLVSEKDIKKIISVYKKFFDYIVIDLPPLFNSVSVGCVEVADHVLMLSTTEIPTLKNVKDGIDTLKKLECPDEKVTVVINRFNNRGELKLEDMIKFLGMGNLVMINDDSATVSTSINIGDPFVLSFKKSTVAKQVLNITNNLIDYKVRQKKLNKSSIVKKVFKR